MAKLYEDFFEALGQRESSGNYTIVNKLGYLGKYQVNYYITTTMDKKLFKNNLCKVF